MLVDQFGNPLVVPARPRRRSRETVHARYDAAQDTMENRKHWAWADNYSASAANSIEVRRRLRSRARYECLEANSFAKGITLTLANDTIAKGPSLQVTLPDRGLAGIIEREWRKWAKAVRLADKLRTARLSKLVDGEAFILKTTNRRLRTPVQLDIKLVEADQISTPGFVEGLPNQVDGIEFDDNGEPINYHMLKSHPGDMVAIGAWKKDDVSPDDMIHMFRRERAGQVRGIPEVTPALPLFAMLRRWTLATIAASETAANFSAVIETTATGFDDEEGPEELDAFSTTEIDRNIMTSLPRGWKMNQFKPEQPTTNYEMFRNAILNEIARCVHMPRNKALADSSNYNYSSGRLDHQTYYQAIDVERDQWELDCLDRIFGWWLDEALLLTAYLPIVGAFDEIPHSWRWTPMKHVDPEKEINAAIMAIEAGLLTEEQYLHQNDIDPESHFAALIRQAIRKRTIAAIAAGPSLSQQAADFGSKTTGNGANDEPAPTGEFSNLSRRQMVNNNKAIDDALDRFESGEWSETRTRVYLSSVGLSDRTIRNLLDEYAVE